MIMATIQSKLKTSGEALPGSNGSASGRMQPPQPPSSPWQQDPSPHLRAARCAWLMGRRGPSWDKGSSCLEQQGLRQQGWKSPPSLGTGRQLSAQHPFASRLCGRDCL